MGRLDLWDRATQALGDALDKAGLAYRVAEGEGAFYGPKIDLHVRDAIGRRWQVTTTPGGLRPAGELRTSSTPPRATRGSGR